MIEITNHPAEGAPQPSSLASAASPRKRTMSEAALAANRANAQKSTGPRTPAGKLKSASNALQHGLYSPSNFENFAHDNDTALEVTVNILEQYQPLTPTEHLLTQQLIHLELRFLQMQYLYNCAMDRTINDILDKPVHFLPVILRELNALPGRIHAPSKRCNPNRTAATSRPAKQEPANSSRISKSNPLPIRNRFHRNRNTKKQPSPAHSAPASFLSCSPKTSSKNTR